MTEFVRFSTLFRSDFCLEIGEYYKIPSSQRNELVSHIEELWLNIQVRPPHWLDNLTLQLVGRLHWAELRTERQCRAEEERRRQDAERQAQLRVAQEAARIAEEQQRRAEEERRRQDAERQAQLRAAQEAARIAEEQRRIVELQARVTQIREICVEREIKTLVHFTHMNNLHGILQEGILSRSVLEARSLAQQPQYNDLQRIDGCTEAVCLSISFPNYRMFYKYSSNNRAEWVILLLDVAVLWELDCAFCQENAASNTVRFISLANRKTPEALRGMFADCGHIRRQDLQIPNNYPTHPQAEVLVFDPIPARYINAVHFLNLAAFQGWFSSNQATYSPTFFYSQQYFVPRSDWEVWQSANLNIYADYDQVNIISDNEIPF